MELQTVLIGILFMAIIVTSAAPANTATPAAGSPSALAPSAAAAGLANSTAPGANSSGAPTPAATASTPANSTAPAANSSGAPASSAAAAALANSTASGANSSGAPPPAATAATPANSTALAENSSGASAPAATAATPANTAALPESSPRVPAPSAAAAANLTTPAADSPGAAAATAPAAALANAATLATASPSAPAPSAAAAGLANSTAPAANSSGAPTPTATAATPTNAATLAAGSSSTSAPSTAAAVLANSTTPAADSPGAPAPAAAAVTPEPVATAGETAASTLNADLKKLCEDLSSKDKNNAMAMIIMNLQGQKTDGSVTDDAHLPLLTVKNEAYELPTIKALLALHDNYELDVKNKDEVTPEERRENDELLDKIYETEIMTTAMKFLSDKEYVATDKYEQKNTLKDIWFSRFLNVGGEPSSSGFETVFLAEQMDNEIIGLHNWIYFAKQEAAKKANYLGYTQQTSLGNLGAIVKMRSSLNGVVQSDGTIFVGTSPELEMALYTVCFFILPNEPCPVSVGGTEFNIITKKDNYFGKDVLVSAYPELISDPTPRLANSSQTQGSSEQSSEKSARSSASSISWSSLLLITIVLFHIDCDIIFRADSVLVI